MRLRLPSSPLWLRLAAAFVAFWVALTPDVAIAQNGPASAPPLPAPKAQAPALRPTLLRDAPVAPTEASKSAQATDQQPAAPAKPHPKNQPDTQPLQQQPAVEYQREVSTRINRTGQPLTLPTQVRETGRIVGEITIRVETDDRIFVPADATLKLIGPGLTSQARARLASLPRTEGRIALADMETARIGLKFDSSQMELVFDPPVDDRAEGDLSVGGIRGTLNSAATADPAKVSGYLNVFGAASQAWAVEPWQKAVTGGALDLQGAVRMRGVALESEGSVDGPVDSVGCAAGALCTYQHQSGLKRRGSRLVYDMAEPQLRLQVGDTQTTGTGGYLRSIDTLGVSLEKNPSKLSPGENIRSVGRTSFRIERASEIDVIVNGAIVQHFQLRPGTYNLRDLPFASGANDIELAITDDTGERKSLKFATFYDSAMLGAGKTEWSLSGGVPSYILDNERKYEAATRTAAAQLRHGLTDHLTMETAVQADMQVVTGSLGLFLQTPAGVFGLQPAASSTQGKPGVAARVAWAAHGFRGSFGYTESSFLSAEWRDTNFRTPGDKINLATQVYLPQALYKLRVTGSHTVALPENLSLTLSARYQFDNPEAAQLTPYTIRGDRYGADVTLSRPLTPAISASILAGYSNESYLHGFAANFNNAKPEFRAAARLYIRPADRTTVVASYDTLNKTTQVSANTSVGSGVDSWNASANAQYVGETRNGSAGAGVAYTGNRAEILVAHSSSADKIAYPSLTATGRTERSTARVGGAIAFADGAIAVGAPVRGDAFAIVKPHETLAGKEIVVGTEHQTMAKTDRLGPALVTNLPSYVPTNVPVQVTDLPIGYSIGTGSNIVVPPFRGGYAIEVGSGYSMTASGTLLDPMGQPLGLQSGVASPEADAKKQVVVFTNSAGRFGADGLAPGRWTLRMDSTHGTLEYKFEVPNSVDGMFKAGTLSPSGASPKKD